jgi:hypothetical protein
VRVPDIELDIAIWTPSRQTTMRLHLLPILLLTIPAACSTPRFQVMPRYMPVDIDGGFGISSTGIDASNDLDDIGVEKDSGVIGARVDLKWGMPHLTLSTQTSAHDGNGTLTADLGQDGTTIPAGADVHTDLDLGLHQAVLTFDLAPTDIVELGLGLGVTAIDLDMKVTDDDTGETIDTDEAVPLPVLALRGAVRQGNFEVAALVTGMSLDISDVDVSFFDVDVFGRWKFLGGDDHLRGSLVIGYRMVTLDVEYDDGDDEVELDMDLTGPYIGLQFGL